MFWKEILAFCKLHIFQCSIVYWGKRCCHLCWLSLGCSWLGGTQPSAWPVVARTPPTTHRYRCIANSIIALHHQRASQLWSKAVETRAKVFFAWRPHNGSHNFHSLQLVGEKSSVVGFGGQVPCARGTHFIFCSRIFSLILRVCNGKSFDLSTAIEHSHTHSGKAIYINRGKHIRKHSPGPSGDATMVRKYL